MRIRKANLHDVAEIAVQGDQISEWLGLTSPAYLFEQTHIAMAMVDDEDKVIAVAGIVTQWEGRGEVWELLAEDTHDHLLILHRGFLKKFRKCGYRRLEATTKVGFTQASRWMQMLGFEKEATMRKYGPEGEDYHLWARVN